MAACTYICM